MSDPRIRKLRDQAADARARSKFAQAVKCYAELERLEPRDGTWPMRAAECHRRLGEEDLQVAALGRAADCYGANGFIVKAIAMCKMILALDPDHQQTQQRLATLSGERKTGLDRVAPTFGEHATAEAGPSNEAHAPQAQPPPPQVLQTQPAQTQLPQQQAPQPPAPLQNAQAQPAQLQAQPPQSQGRQGLAVPSASAPRWSTPPSLRPGASIDTLSLNSIVAGSIPPPEIEDDGVYEIPLEDIEYLEDSLPPAQEPPPLSATSSREALRAELSRVPLLASLEPAALSSVIEHIELVDCEASELIFQRGSAAEACYVLVEGQVALLAEGPLSSEVARLGESDVFGVVGILSDRPCAHTAMALGSCRLLRLGRAAIAELLESAPNFLNSVLLAARDRMVQALLHWHPLFAEVQPMERPALAGRFTFLEVEKGARLIVQDKPATHLFIVLTGRMQALRETEGEPRVLGDLDTGALFGDISLVLGEPSFATICAVEKSFVLALPESAFRELAMTDPRILAFLSTHADRRRSELDAILSGQANYDEGRLTIS